MTYRTGGEGGILAQSLSTSCHLFSNMHEKRLNTADFSDFYYFNSTKIFSCLVLIFALNRHQRHQGSDRASPHAHSHFVGTHEKGAALSDP